MAHYAPFVSINRGVKVAVVAAALAVPALVNPSAMAEVPASNLENVTQVDNPKDWYPDHPNYMVIAVPGTDDTSFFVRNQGIFGNREAYRFVYDEAAGPFISGRSGKLALFAPSYAESVDAAVPNLVEVFRQINEQAPEGGRKQIILQSFSQGGRVAYEAAVIAVEKGYLDENDLIAFYSSPGGPWGLGTQAEKYPLLPELAGLFGFKTGVDDPAKLGDVPVEHRVIFGDSVGGQMLDFSRPLRSLVVLGVGHMIHSGSTSQSYNNLDKLGTPTVFKSPDGKTTVYLYEDVHHPLTLGAELIANRLTFGLVQLDEAQLDRLDVVSNRFYELKPLDETNAGMELIKVSQGDLPDYRGGYTVTVPAESAVGASSSPEIVSEETAPPAVQEVESPPVAEEPTALPETTTPEEVERPEVVEVEEVTEEDTRSPDVTESDETASPSDVPSGAEETESVDVAA